MMALQRAVVTDDGRKIRLTVYDNGDDRVIELSPLDALQLADDLIGIALPRVANQLRQRGAV